MPDIKFDGHMDMITTAFSWLPVGVFALKDLIALMNVQRSLYVQVRRQIANEYFIRVSRLCKMSPQLLRSLHPKNIIFDESVVCTKPCLDSRSF